MQSGEAMHFVRGNAAQRSPPARAPCLSGVAGDGSTGFSATICGDVTAGAGPGAGGVVGAPGEAGVALVSTGGAFVAGVEGEGAGAQAIGASRHPDRNRTRNVMTVTINRSARARASARVFAGERSGTPLKPAIEHGAPLDALGSPRARADVEDVEADAPP